MFYYSSFGLFALLKPEKDYCYSQIWDLPGEKKQQLWLIYLNTDNNSSEVTNCF